MKGTLKIPEDAFCNLKVILGRSAHMLTGLLNNKRQVWPGEGEIL